MNCHAEELQRIAISVLNHRDIVVFEVQEFLKLGSILVVCLEHQL